MSQAVHVVITDDIDDSQIEPADTVTVQWSWRGVMYEFDTRRSTIAAIEKGECPISVSELLVKSRKAVPAASRTPAAACEPAVVRAWARRHGHAVPSRGRIPFAIRQAFDMAQA